MHVVFVSQVFYPDSQSTSQLFTDLFFALKDEQVQVTVVTGYPAGKSGGRLAKVEELNGVEIRRSGTSIDFKKGLIRRALHYAFYVLGSTIELWKLRHCDLVVGVTNPPFMPVWLWGVRRLFLPRYQLILGDIFPEGLVALGHLKRDGWITRLWRGANRRALQSAGKVLVLGRDMEELVKSVYGVPQQRLVFSPHWSALEVQNPRPIEKSETLHELGLNGKFVVQYSGNMGLWHDIDMIVRADHRLHAERAIHFLLIGDGRRRAQAERLAAELKLQNITWLPFQPKEVLHDSLACCHVALISQRAELWGVAVPCKLYGILASGRAVLASVPQGCEVDLVVREEECGVVVPPGDAVALAEAIRALHQDRDRTATMGRNAFRAYREKYTLAAAVERFRQLWNHPTRKPENRVGVCR